MILACGGLYFVPPLTMGHLSVWLPSEKSGPSLPSEKPAAAMMAAAPIVAAAAMVAAAAEPARALAARAWLDVRAPL